MKTVEIPGIGTATFREAADLRAKDSDLLEAALLTAAGALEKLPPEAVETPDEESSDEEKQARAERIRQAMIEAGFTFAESQALTLLRRVTIIATLQSWTYPRPIPKTLDELAELPRDVVSSLDVAIGELGAMVGTDFSVSSDRRSPTTPSSESNGVSRDGSANTTLSTSEPSSGSEVTDSASSTV